MPAKRAFPGEGVSSRLRPVAAAQPPAPAGPDSLALAAECLERGDRAGAAVHLEAHVRLHPDQLMFRAQLAELLLRLGRDRDAKAHYERFAADAQAATGAPRTHLVTAHTRLMEIAQRADDRFAEVFHRGVGLLLLVKAQDKLPDRDADFAEEMLCKAIKALAEAKELKPADPRVRVYLAEAYDRSGNRRAADAERAAIGNGFVLGELTPTERKQVMLRE
jgi:predicted Zn-dependent protease